MIRFAFFFLLLFAASVSPAAEKLVVGMELAYPPFEMRDKSGEPAGVSVDLARALGEHLKREVEIRNLPFDGLIPALKTGKIDLIISSMTASEERAKTVDFSEPYLRTGLCLLVGADSNIQSIADADRAGCVVAVKKGTTGHLYASKSLKNARPLVLDKETACVLEVTQGKAHAFIYDQMSVLKHWQQNRDKTRAVLQPFQQEAWAVAIRKGRDDLRAQVNEFLAAFRKQGGFDRLGEKWLAESKAEFTKLGVQFVF